MTSRLYLQLFNRRGHGHQDSWAWSSRPSVGRRLRPEAAYKDELNNTGDAVFEGQYLDS